MLLKRIAFVAGLFVLALFVTGLMASVFFSYEFYHFIRSTGLGMVDGAVDILTMAQILGIVIIFTLIGTIIKFIEPKKFKRTKEEKKELFEMLKEDKPPDSKNPLPKDYRLRGINTGIDMMLSQNFPGGNIKSSDTWDIKRKTKRKNTLMGENVSLLPSHYYARSNVESTFGALKAKFNDCLKSKTLSAQKNELLLKVLCFNIVQVIHETNELGIEARFT